MNKAIIILCFLLSLGLAAFAQTGKITGKVLNQKNEPIPGVSVKILGAPGGVSTDVDGVFTLTLSAGKTYSLEFSAIGFGSKTIGEVEVSASNLTELNITLEKLSKDLGEVTVRAQRSTARKETIASLIQYQKNTNTVAAVISGESIRRSPDKNTR